MIIGIVSTICAIAGIKLIADLARNKTKLSKSSSICFTTVVVLDMISMALTSFKIL